MALTKINANVIANNTIAVGNIADNSVDGTKIASNSILTRHIDDAQITTDQILDGTIATADIADDAVTSAKVANNIALPGTGGVTLPAGTTAERPGSPADGVFRFNTTTDIMEYYNGTGWQGVVQAAPAATSISPTTAISANQVITITGTGFQSGATVKFVGNDGTEYNSPTVVFNSATQLTATTPSTALTVANEPYDIKVINASGFSGTLNNALDAGSTPAFGVASGSLGSVAEGGNASGFTQITATDADSQSVSITLKSGSSLPSGVSMSTSGVFSGTLPTTGSDVTTSFTVQASDGTNVAERDYNITATAPQYAQLSGSGTWSVPSGVNTAEILIVGGGASGSRSPNIATGGGGGGGIVYKASYTFTSTDKSSGIAYSVGAGGDGVGISPLAYDGGYNNGAPTTFALSGGTITANGGGGAGGYGGNSPHMTEFSTSYYTAHSGGSGGGGSWNQMNGGASNQGTFSGWTSYGNAGGAHVNGTGGGHYNGGGGGGAGGAGGIGYSNTSGQTDRGGAGGAGQLFSSFTSYGASGYFGGGGGGGSQDTSSSTRGAAGSGGGGAGGYNASNQHSGGDATDTTGGGGGGVANAGYATYNYKSGDGGNGTILLKY